MKKVTLIIFAAFLSLSTFAQSPTIDAFVDKSEGYNLFLYQSMIRVLNKDKNPDFNMLIRDLEHLRFVTHSKSRDAGGKDAFKSLDNGIAKEGYGLIMSVDNKDYKCHFYEMETRGGSSHWVATMYIHGWAGLMEMKGAIDLEYLDALGSLNVSKLADYLPMEDFKRDVEVLEEELKSVE